MLRVSPLSHYPRLLEAFVAAKVAPSSQNLGMTRTTKTSQTRPGHSVHSHRQDRGGGGKHELATSDDVEEYVEALRTALNSAIAEGKRIMR